MQIFIYSPTYDDNSGGSVVLHRLCHLINSISDHQAYLIPFSSKSSVKKNMLGKLIVSCKDLVRPKHFTNFALNRHWNTPVWRKRHIPDQAIVIYPEIISGNPLKSHHVVRWLLHQPGFHTNGQVNYGSNELYFKFNSAIKDFSQGGSVVSKHELKVIYYPIDIYHSEDISVRDIGSCHMIRKGSYKTFIHDQHSIELDGKSHGEIAAIFRRSKRFICYDDYTAYSIFAVLCGCESIVVPAEGVAIESWYPNEADRYGIAYGLSEQQLSWAKKTQHKVLEHIIDEHKNSEKRVLTCLKEIESFFN